MQSSIWNSNLKGSTQATASPIFTTVPWRVGKTLTTKVDFDWERWQCGSGYGLTQLELPPKKHFQRDIQPLRGKQKGDLTFPKGQKRVLVLTIVCLKPDEPQKQKQKAPHGWTSWMAAWITAVRLTTGQLGARGDPSWPHTPQEAGGWESSGGSRGCLLCAVQRGRPWPLNLCRRLWRLVTPLSGSAFRLRKRRITSERQGWRNS